MLDGFSEGRRAVIPEETWAEINELVLLAETLKQVNINFLRLAGSG